MIEFVIFIKNRGICPFFIAQIVPLHIFFKEFVLYQRFFALESGNIGYKPENINNNLCH